MSGDGFAAALTDALDEIVDRASTCELPLPIPKTGTLDRDLVNVIYSPGDGSAAKLLAQDNSAACDTSAAGWQYADDDSKIRLCASTCTTLRADAGARVDVVLGCPVRGPE